MLSDGVLETTTIPETHYDLLRMFNGGLGPEHSAGAKLYAIDPRETFRINWRSFKRADICDRRQFITPELIEAVPALGLLRPDLREPNPDRERRGLAVHTGGGTDGTERPPARLNDCIALLGHLSGYSASEGVTASRMRRIMALATDVQYPERHRVTATSFRRPDDIDTETGWRISGVRELVGYLAHFLASQK